MRCISGVTFDSYQPAETGMAAAIPRTFHLGHDDPRPSGYRRSGLSTEQRSSASSLVAVYLAQIGRPRAIFCLGCVFTAIGSTSLDAIRLYDPSSPIAKASSNLIARQSRET